MDFLPTRAQFDQMLSHLPLNRLQFVQGETIVLAQRHRTVRAIQEEQGLASIPDDVNVRRPMMVRVNDKPQLTDPKSSRHRDKYSRNPSV
jgi:hypothetical protein